MKNYKSNFGKPYIKIFKKSDLNKLCDFSVYVAMLNCLRAKEKFYILICRNTNIILMCGTSKDDIINSVIVKKSNKNFNIWCNKYKLLVQEDYRNSRNYSVL